MSKAKIIIAGTGLGGFLGAIVSFLGLDDGCKCMFNPAEFQIQRAVHYAEHKVPGLDRPILQFINGEAEIMKFSLFFDTYSSILPDLLKSDVRKHTDPFYELMNVNEDKHAPDLVTFEWGKTKFTGYIIDINQKFTMFTSRGTAVRATLEITLKSNKKDNNIRNSPDRSKHRVIVNRDALYGFAYAEYGDCSEWRRIAEANGIDNPRRLKSGDKIIVPAII